MKKIILSTESGADLPEELVKKYDVQVVPMHVIMDGKDYLDGHIPVTDIYDYYNRTKKIPSTTSTNANEYHDLFTEIRNDNPDSIIIHIGYTSKASSSFQNAVLAADDFDDIHLIDALNVTGGLAAVVLYAARLLEQQPDIQPTDLIKKIETKVPRTRLAFVPGSLEFLKAGGRVSNAAYIGGSLLKIKPLIELIDGKLVSTKKYRGKMEGVADKLLEDYFKNYNIDKDQLYFIYSHGLPDNVKRQLDQTARDRGFRNITWIEAGGVISTHAGPGGFGVAGIEE